MTCSVSLPTMTLQTIRKKTKNVFPMMFYNTPVLSMTLSIIEQYTTTNLSIVFYSPSMPSMNLETILKIAYKCKKHNILLNFHG